MLPSPFSRRVGTMLVGVILGCKGWAAEFTVTTLADAGPGSLRAALIQANATPGEDRVRFAVEGTIALASALPEVRDSLVVEGPGADRLRVSGEGNVQVLVLGAGTANRVSGLTLANGRATGGRHGAGVSNLGVLTLVDCAVVGNHTLAGWGGGIFNGGELTVLNSVVSSNSVTGGEGLAGPASAGGGGGGLGGGIFSTQGRLTVSNTVVEANLAAGGRGGSPAGSGTRGGAGGGPQGGAAGTAANRFNGFAGGLGGGGGGGGASTNTAPRPNGGVGGQGGVGGGGGGGSVVQFPYTPGGGSVFGGGTGATASNVFPTGGPAAGGGGAGLGGAVFCDGGIVRLERCRLIRNRTEGARGGVSGLPSGGGGGYGGGLFALGGDLEMLDCWVANNACVGGNGVGGYGAGKGGQSGGGGVLLWNTTANVVGTTVSSNTIEAGAAAIGTRDVVEQGAAAWGGGMALLGGATWVTNGTLSGNSAKGGLGGSSGSVGTSGGPVFGGGLHAVTNQAVLVHNTVTGNRAIGGDPGPSHPTYPIGPAGESSGGGFHVTNGTLTLRNTLVTGNTRAIEFLPSDGSGTVASLGRNLVGVSTQISGLSGSDLIGVDAKLGALVLQGGVTPTHALLEGSAALDAALPEGAPVVDQRGVSRPFGAGYDIGAFERGAPPPGVLEFRLEGEPVTAESATHLGPVEVSLVTSFPKGAVLYTLDGSVPTHGSVLYTEPLMMTNSALIRAFAYDRTFSATTGVVSLALTILPDARRALVVSAVGEGRVEVEPPGTRYEAGTRVRLTAVPSEGWRLAGWSGDASGNGKELEVLMDADRTVRAEFEPVAVYRLKVSTALNELTPRIPHYGSGRVVLDPPGGVYASNTVVTLSAEVPRVPYVRGYTGFKRWIGDLQGSGPQVTVRMDRDRSVTAEFEFTGWSPGGYWLTRSAVGGGAVLPTVSSGLGMDVYWGVNQVGLVAAPNAGWTFLGWMGDFGGPENPHTIPLNEDSHGVGVFGTTLKTEVSGRGTIQRAPDRLTYPGGSRVRLWVVPAPGHYFVMWGGAVSGRSLPAELTIHEAQPEVSALFAPLPEGQVEMNVRAVGDGDVRVSPALPHYPVGTRVTLTAEPREGQSFLGWAGTLDGMNPVISVTLEESRSVMARFTARPTLALVQLFDYRQPGAYRFRVDGELDALYAIESSPDLRAWSRFTVVTNTFGSTLTRGPTEPVGGRVFYRATQVGP